MSKLKAVRKRISSVTKIRKITNAMQVVALTRLRKMEHKTLDKRFYFDRIRQMLFDMARHTNYSMHPLLEDRDSDSPLGVIVLGSDKGLCGNFNNNAISRLSQIKQERPGAELLTVGIGKKIVKFLSARKEFNLQDTYTPVDMDTIDEATARIANLFVEKFLKRQLNCIYVVYNEFKLQFAGKTKMIQLLPLRLKVQEKLPHRRNYIYEPEPRELFTLLLTEYIASQIHQAIFESRTAEEMARMLAMKTATENAGEMIESLTVSYHKARQAQITKELTEIVSAAEAMA